MGKFQGVIRPTTPTGSRVTSTATSGRTEATASPVTADGFPGEEAEDLRGADGSPLASARVLPSRGPEACRSHPRGQRAAARPLPAGPNALRRGHGPAVQRRICGVDGGIDLVHIGAGIGADHIGQVGGVAVFGRIGRTDPFPRQRGSFSSSCLRKENGRLFRPPGGELAERLQSGLCAPEDQGVHVVGAFVGVHGLEVHHVAHHRGTHRRSRCRRACPGLCGATSSALPQECAFDQADQLGGAMAPASMSSAGAQRSPAGRGRFPSACPRVSTGSELGLAARGLDRTAVRSMPM